MENLRKAVNRLEARYQEAQDRKSTVSTTSSVVSTAYANVLTSVSQLKEENFVLKQTLHEKQKLRQTMERLISDQNEQVTPLEDMPVVRYTKIYLILSSFSSLGVFVGL